MENKMRETRSGLSRMGVVGICLLSAIVPAVKNGYDELEEEVKMLRNPVTITQEYRNDDKHLDIVQTYEDGSESVLYGYRDSESNIQYRLQE